MRFAISGELLKRLGNAYQKNAAVQDAVETLGGAAISAGGQALFTDMSPEEIAISTLLGGAAAMAARPVAANLGGRLGKVLDKKFPGALEGVPQELASIYPGSGPSVRVMQQQVREAPRGSAERKVAEVMKNLNLSKYNQNMRGKGDVEGLLTMLGRYQGDNAAQLAVAIAAPAILGIAEEEANQLVE